MTGLCRTSETETFGYDFLDRLTSASGPYSESYAYSQIGNMVSKDGISYTYPTNGVRPHAVSQVGSTTYDYDDNGNTTIHGDQTITWDAENRPVSVIGGGGGEPPANWWDGDWTARRQLTFNTTGVSSDLTSFPVLVHLTTSNFDFALAQAHGGDLRFVDSDNTTVLKYEVEEWTSTEAWAWVKVPTLRGSRTTDFIWVYYGNSGASDGWDVANTWESSYKVVTHMKDSPDSSHVADSTSNGLNGTKVSAGYPVETATGKTGPGQDFTPNDYINAGDTGIAGSWTIEAWVNRDSIVGDYYIMGLKLYSGAGIGLDNYNNNWYYYDGVGVTVGTTSVGAGTWTKLAVVYNGSQAQLYRDGNAEGTAQSVNDVDITLLNIGRTSNGYGPLDGKMDEVRVSSTARSGDWVKVSYLSESDSLISVGEKEQPSQGSGTTTFVYDGDGNRVMKTESGEDILYVNKYFEKNLTTGNVTTYYFLGDRLVAKRTGATVQYMHQDHLTGTSLTTSTGGSVTSTISYTPFGTSRSVTGTLPTDKLFTGQRLDDTGLYYYGARYYDPTIGRFVSPDTVVPTAMDPQSFNRYSYVVNNPLKYTDPTGMLYAVDYEFDPNDVLGWYTYASLSSQIESAYQQIVGDAGVPSWIQGYMRTVHDSDRVINVEFGNFGGSVGLSAMDVYTYGQAGDSQTGLVHVATTQDYIGIDYSWMSNLAPALTHESYHVYEGNPGASIAEEFAAYTAQYFVQKSFPDPWFNISGGLGSSEFLSGVQSQLTAGGSNAANVYRVMPLRQGEMTQQSLALQGIIASQMMPSGWRATTVSYLASGIFYTRGIPWK